jgi:hypothetical protein
MNVVDRNVSGSSRNWTVAMSVSSRANEQPEADRQRRERRYHAREHGAAA